MEKQKTKVMIADDDKKTREFIAASLAAKGYDCTHAFDGQDALEKLDSDVQVVVTDVMMPRLNGLQLVEKLRASRPDLLIITCSAFESFDMLSNMVGAGAFCHIEKPINLENLAVQIKRGLEAQATINKTTRPKPIRPNCPLNKIIGESSEMASLFRLIERVAPSESTVLLQGESGTGKEVIARAVHDLSKRSNKAFIAINCAAIPDELLESELFGHVKGAFTGAVGNHTGRFEQADKGTLFLDEIGDMKLHLQVKLLRALQNREIEPVGGTRAKKIDVRIIAATNKNLEEMVKDGTFREDLYYRLAVIPVTTPPLRNRGGDIALLLNSFLKKQVDAQGLCLEGFDSQVLETLSTYSWPGNVRELENLVERLSVIATGKTITYHDLPEKYRQNKPVGLRLDELKPSTSKEFPPLQAVKARAEKIIRSAYHEETVKHHVRTIPEGGLCLSTAMDDIETSIIMQALEKCDGNKQEAADLLGVKRTTLLEKLRKKGLVNSRNTKVQKLKICQVA